MVRPRRPVLNWTTPGRVAKIVWSRPMPTPFPGRKRVPRWRTMISPPSTVWPENTFTPSIFGFESRPLRLDPSPFLCAIAGLLLLRRGLLRRLLPRRALLLGRAAGRPPREHLHVGDLESGQLRAVPGAAAVAL